MCTARLQRTLTHTTLISAGSSGATTLCCICCQDESWHLGVCQSSFRRSVRRRNYTVWIPQVQGDIIWRELVCILHHQANTKSLYTDHKFIGANWNCMYSYLNFQGKGWQLTGSRFWCSWPLNAAYDTAIIHWKRAPVCLQIYVFKARREAWNQHETVAGLFAFAKLPWWGKEIWSDHHFMVLCIYCKK